MRASLLIFGVVMAVASGFYLGPRNQQTNSVNPKLYSNLAKYFNRLHVAAVKRCANVFDESCVNDGLAGIGRDDDWLNGGGTPGKRCANIFDEGCANDGLGGGGADDDWLTGGGTPGKRCANVFDEGCANGELGGAIHDEGWLGPGRR